MKSLKLLLISFLLFSSVAIGQNNAKSDLVMENILNRKSVRKYTKEEVKKVAALSKLSFKEEELELFTSQMGKIIDMVEELGEVDTEGVPFTSNVVSEINVLREDVVIKGESREELLNNVPETKDGFIKVPAIMDNGEAGA